MISDVGMDLQPGNVLAFTRFFQALSEPTRLRIVRLLATSRKSACACEIMDSIKEPEYHVWRHLYLLRDAGVLREEPAGRWKYFALNDQDPVAREMAQVAAALQAATFEADSRNFQERLAWRENGRCIVGSLKPHLLEQRKQRRAKKAKERAP